MKTWLAGLVLSCWMGLAGCKASVPFDHFSCEDGHCPPGQFCHKSDGLCHRQPEGESESDASTAGAGAAADGGGATEGGDGAGETGSSGVGAPRAGRSGNGSSGTNGNAGQSSGDSGNNGGPSGGTGGTPSDAGNSAESGSGGTPQSGSGGMGGMPGPIVVSGGRILGESCQAGADCASTWCADGVCCQSECADSCSACNLLDNIGVCTALPAGNGPSAGHPPCDAEPESSCGKTGMCDGAGECALWNDVVCKAASCDAAMNSVTSDSKCNGSGECIGPAAISCSPFTCDAAGKACRTSCTGSEQCAAPNPCVTGSCGEKPNGSVCSAGTDCTSGNCIDGYCCDGECGGACEACNLPATLGRCSPVTSGQPHGGRGMCSGTTPCKGGCTSASRSACTFPGSGTSCRATSCLGSTLTAAASCNGSGGCPATSTNACPGNLTCNSAGTACLTSCTSPANCTASAPNCVSGSCTTARPNGSSCTSGSQCQSNACVDGVCCNSGCGGQCEACDVTGSAGTCTAVTSGAPHGSRAACAGSDACVGACSAGSRTACAYPGGGTQCAAAGCQDTSTALSARFCDGAGGCAAATATTCATGACTDGACGTCFVAGTLVDTDTGLRPIETIRPGERVRTYDELTGRSSYRSVIERERRIARGLVDLTLASGATITVSPEHQIWVQDTGWVRAANLTLDDSLISAQGAAVGVKSLETVALDAVTSAAGVEVFNLLVEQSPTYYVGPDAVLVHSCDYLNFSALDPADAPQ